MNDCPRIHAQWYRLRFQGPEDATNTRSSGILRRKLDCVSLACLVIGEDILLALTFPMALANGIERLQGHH